VPEAADTEDPTEVPSPDFIRFASDMGCRPCKISTHVDRNILRQGIDFALRFFSNEIKPLKNRRGNYFRPEMHYLTGLTWPNAAISKVDSTHCIGVSDTMMYQFVEISRFIFSRRDSFSFIGDSANEARQDWPLATPLGLSWMSNDSVSHRDLMIAMQPKCPIRRAYCQLLLTDMLEFVWFHELGHGTSGHADYIEATFGAWPFFESPVAGHSIPGFSKSTRQNIELIADEASIDIHLSYLVLDHRSVISFAGARLSRAQWTAFRYMSAFLVFISLCLMDMHRDGLNLFRLDPAADYPTSFLRLWSQFIVVLTRITRNVNRFEEIQEGAGLAIQELRILAEQGAGLEFLLVIADRERLRAFTEYFNYLAKSSTAKNDMVDFLYASDL
jgi:hypothetical protein